MLKRIKEVFQRATNPLARKLWYTSVFQYHKFFAPKVFLHCLFNVHHLGTILNKKLNGEIFMIQHFCATCYPDVLNALNEQFAKMKAEQEKQREAEKKNAAPQEQL